MIISFEVYKIYALYFSLLSEDEQCYV